MIVRHLLKSTAFSEWWRFLGTVLVSAMRLPAGLSTAGSGPAIVGLATFGATAGPLVDAVHNQALLTYDFLPLSLGPVQTSWLVPPLLAVAYVLLGLVFPAVSDSIFGVGRIALDNRPLLQPRQRAGLAVLSTLAIIKTSEVLVSSTLSTSSSVALLCAACAAQWVLLDGSYSSLALSLLAAWGGPLAELPLLKAGCWHYLAPDYFPLDGIGQLGPGSWAGLNSITAPCYAAVTNDAIALGRWLSVCKEENDQMG